MQLLRMRHHYNYFN